MQIKTRLAPEQINRLLEINRPDCIFTKQSTDFYTFPQGAALAGEFLIFDSHQSENVTK